MRIDEIEGVFPSDVIVLSAPISDEALDTLHPAERALAPNAMPKRMRELATGRALAHAALERLGHPTNVISSDPQRAPIFPDGVRGSITHCDTRALAAVCLSGSGSVGIDVEHRSELKESLWASVFLPEERAALAALASDRRGRMALALFSAKESLYKAQFPISRTYMGFRALHVAAADGELVCTFQEDVPPFARGFVARGRYLLAAPPTGELLTGVHIPR